MNHNKHNFQVGDTAIVDSDKPNRSKVIIEYFTPQQMFARVRAENNYTWEIMTYRLSPIGEK